MLRRFLPLVVKQGTLDSAFLVSVQSLEESQRRRLTRATIFFVEGRRPLATGTGYWHWLLNPLDTFI